MLARIRRRLSLPLAGVLAAILSLAAVAGTDPPPSYLIIYAPDQVMAGNPICGFVTGFTYAVNVTGEDITNPQQLPGSPTSGMVDPWTFMFGTTEWMMGDIVVIHASDLGGATASHITMVM